MIWVAALALAQAEPNCIAPTIQPEMNACAFIAFDKADAAMNRAWAPLVAKMKERDRDFDRGADKRFSYHEALVASQRAWLKFRDAHCKTEGYFARGGSMEPMVLGQCLEQVTATRTRQLQELLERFSL